MRGIGGIVAALALSAVGVAGPGVASASPAVGASPPGAVPTASSYGGTLTATGVCPFDYEYDSSGQSWANATYSGTLTGFVANQTYYVYDDNGDTNGDAPQAVTANAMGAIALVNADLDIQGPSFWGNYPDSIKTIPISIGSEDQPYEQSPPVGQVYRPVTRLLINPKCNAWIASGGTTILGDATSDMTSTNGRYFMGEHVAVQNGFVITQFPKGGKYATQVVWSTHTSGTNTYLVMQKDGNVVVYSEHGKALWQTHTYGHPGAYLVLQRDRNLVVYSAAGKALWQSGTSIG